MKNLSFWAKKNPLRARTAIVILKLLLGCYGIYLGGWLMSIGIRLPSELLIFLVAGYLAAVFFYPVRGATSGIFNYTYRRQKICDFAIGLSTMLLFVGGSNDLLGSMMIRDQVSAEAVTVAIRRSTPTKDWRTYKSDKHRSRLGKVWQKGKDFFRSLFKSHRKAKKIETWQVLVTILVALAALFALALVAALSCTIACNGSDGLAVVVAIFGTALVVYLYVIAIKALYRKTGDEKAGIWLAIGILLLTILIAILASNI